MKQISTTHTEKRGSGKLKLYFSAAASLLAGAAIGFIIGSARSHVTIDLRGVASTKEPE